MKCSQTACNPHATGSGRSAGPTYGETATWLSWLRNAPQSPAARNILRLIERLASIRALGLDRARADMIPASTFDRLADEGSRITPQHLGELNALRRHATLAQPAYGLRKA
ncbi:hypothetical protein [Sphingobium xenophagum]|uniref:hypothetical protein n=1 Tax=Sphingobium xenophagum TaxID=121428 RepID=UPI001FD1E291|nr:hypothetical protein [Sphingobium xenophagum]